MSVNSSRLTCLTLLLGLSASPALAQMSPPANPVADPAASPEPEATDDALSTDIVVLGTRLRGGVDAPQAPVGTLEEDDIAAYGVSSIADLVTALSPQASSGRGRGGSGGGFPAVLVNGQRVSNYREMRRFPPEAIRRVEVLPEETALRYGFPPNQRVINFILKPNFSSKTAEVEYSQPDRGGSSTIKGEATLLTIDGPRRLNITAEVEHTSPLTEGKRGVIQSAGNIPTVVGDPDPGFYRTLIARSADYGANATWSTGLGSSPAAGSLSLNAAVSKNRTLSLSGLDTVLLTSPSGAAELRSLGDPLERLSNTLTVQGGAVVNKPLGAWQLNVTADANHTESKALIDRRADTRSLVDAAAAGALAIAGPLPPLAGAGLDRADTATNSVTSLATLIGRPLRLPAGEVAATVKLGYAYNTISSRDTRSGLGETKLNRGDLTAGVNLGIPLTSRKEGALAAIGDLSLNLSAGINHLSDFGTLTDWSAGLTWSPTERLTLGASYIVNQAAPSLGNLGNPQILSLNVPVYDFTRGETALVTLISGGNPALVRETQRDIKLSANWDMPFLKNSKLIVEYFRNRSRDVTAAFPLLTPPIDVAFPGRVVRDAAGRLVSIDQRPVTFARTSAARLRYGINLSGNLGKQTAGGADGRGSGGGFRGMMGRGGGRGRWNLALYHTVQFTDQVVVAPGGPLLDLLNGDALTGGGVARHALELDAGAFYKGFGLRLSGNYAAPTFVRSSGLPGTGDLRFGSLFKLNTRAFVDLGQQKSLTDASPLFKGARLAVFVNNVFDQRQRVTDAAGTVPLNYQADRIDPRGRVIGVEFRKMF